MDGGRMFLIGILMGFSLFAGPDASCAEGNNDAIFRAFKAQYCESFSEKFKAICNRSQNSVDFIAAVKKQGSSEVCGKSFLSDVIIGATSKTLTQADEKCKAGTEESRRITDLHLAFFRGAKSSANCGGSGAGSNLTPSQK